MSNRRVDLSRIQELVRLHRVGEKPRKIARLLSMSPNTERFYRRLLDEAGMLNGAPDAMPKLDAMRVAIEQRAPAVIPPQQISTVVGWSERVRQLLASGLGPRAIHESLSREDASFSGSYPAIKRLCRRLRGPRENPSHQSVVVPADPDAASDPDASAVSA
jgi:hypothetical protein